MPFLVVAVRAQVDCCGRLPHQLALVRWRHHDRVPLHSWNVNEQRAHAHIPFELAEHVERFTADAEWAQC